MTGIAFLAELSVVWVIVTMTADAGRCCLPVLVASRVAAVASEGLVRTVEAKVSKRMVEFGFVEVRDDRIPALMIGVTVRTFES